MISWFEKRSWLSWIIVVLVAIFIFYMSSQSFPPSSGGNPLKSILYHLIIFFVFTFFLMISSVRGKNRNFILLAFSIAILYGVLDELHQGFVPGRDSSLGDIFFDSAGIILASMVYFISVLFRSNKTKL